jgi:hypothetical protein
MSWLAPSTRQEKKLKLEPLFAYIVYKENHRKKARKQQGTKVYYGNHHEFPSQYAQSEVGMPDVQVSLIQNISVERQSASG